MKSWTNFLALPRRGGVLKGLDWELNFTGYCSLSVPRHEFTSCTYVYSTAILNGPPISKRRVEMSLLILLLYSENDLIIEGQVHPSANLKSPN